MKDVPLNLILRNCNARPIWGQSVHCCNDRSSALVAHDTLGADGQRLLDDHVLNAVLVLMLTTSILGPVLTKRFAPRPVAGAS